MKKRKRITTTAAENCSVCGTSALERASADDDNRGNPKDNKSSTGIRGSVIELEPEAEIKMVDNSASEEKADEAESAESEPEKSPDPQKPSPEIPSPGNDVPEIPVIPSPQPEIQKPIKMEDTPIFGSSVRSDGKFGDDRENSTGIIYEIAEQLYLREKTMSEIEALCRPPFRKVFSQTQLDELDKQAADRTKRLVSAAGSSGREPVFLPDGVEATERPIGVGRAFLLQLVMMVPLLNVLTALLLSFGRQANKNMKSYSRAFLIWTVIFMTAALVYFAVFYFTSPVNHAQVVWIMNMFRV